jgi:hypothetical protein
LAASELEDLFGDDPLHASRKRTIRTWLIWLSVFFTGFAGEAWCVLEQVLTIPLTSDPDTIEQSKRLQTTSHWFIAGAVVFGLLIVVALAKLVLMISSKAEAG